MRLLLFILSIILNGIFCSSSTYRAGIVQIDEDVNVSFLTPYIPFAKKNGVEILVFPELCLNQFAEGPGTFEEIVVGSTPCDDSNVDNFIQKNMSCETRNNGIYVVFDMVEKGKECEKGTSFCDYGFYIYNTAVVMDRKGTVIGKYRKINTIVASIKPGDPVLYHFTTDFGVEFGVFICYDILFKMPSDDIIRDLKINNIIYPTFWIDTLFVDGSQIQQGYSEYFQVNLIAPNTVEESEGSGIYHRGYPIITNDTISNKFLCADIPIFDPIPPPPIFSKGENIPFKQELDTKVINPSTTSNDNNKVLHFEVESHKCDITYMVKGGDDRNDENFLFGAIRVDQGGIKTESCVVVNCGTGPTDILNCMNDSPVSIFEYLQVNMTLVDEKIRVVYPLVSTEGRKDLKQFNRMQFIHESGFHSLTLSDVEEPISTAVQFGIF